MVIQDEGGGCCQVFDCQSLSKYCAVHGEAERCMSEGCDRAAKLCLTHSGAGESEKCAIYGCDRFAHICVEHKAEQVRKAAEYVQKAFTGYTDAVHVVMTPFHGAVLLRHLHDLKKGSASTNGHKILDEIIERVKAGINIYLKKR